MKVGFIDTKYSGCNISGSYLQFHPVHQESAWQCVCFPPETESVDGRLFPRRRVRVSTPFAFCLSAAAILAFHFPREREGVIICVFTEQKDHSARGRQLGGGHGWLKGCGWL